MAPPVRTRNEREAESVHQPTQGPNPMNLDQAVSGATFGRIVGITAHLLGHSRLQVTNCYLGSAAALPKHAGSAPAQARPGTSDAALAGQVQSPRQ